MQFGKRNIRSAGRGSGSIEVTLPVELAVLEGIACRLYLREGLAPEIVLQPDLEAITAVFEKLWDLLSIGLAEIGEIGDFAEADYCFGLFCAAKLGANPSLAYVDALLIHRSLDSSHETAPRALESFAQIIESMAAVAGGRLKMSSDVAALFGNQVAYFVSGDTIGARDPFARSLASRSTDAPRDPGWSYSLPVGADSWRRVQSDLMHIYDQFRSWDAAPDLFTRERERWYRARHFEARLRTTHA